MYLWLFASVSIDIRTYVPTANAHTARSLYPTNGSCHMLSAAFAHRSFYEAERSPCIQVPLDETRRACTLGMVSCGFVS